MFAVLLLFGAASLLAPLLVRRFGPWAFPILAFVPLAALVHAIVVAPAVLGGRPIVESFAWIPAFGIVPTLRMDALAWLLVIIATGVGALVLAYCMRYFPRGEPGLGRFAAALTAFAGSMVGLVLADDVFTLVTFWEATSVFLYLLIAHRRDLRSSRGAALQALLVTTLGGLVMLVGLVVLTVETGTSRVSGIVEAIVAVPDGPLAITATALIVVGIVSKSALWPLHFWLPRAMAAPTPVSAYLHAAAMVKAGVYLVARLAPGFIEVPGFRESLILLGIVTMLLGGIVAMRQHDLKLLLAYGTVSQLGFLVTVFAIGTREAALAGLALLLAHALGKSALFLVTGVIDHRTGTRDIRRLSQLGRQAPVLAATAIVAAAGMIGLPPALGFVAKEAVFTALLGGTASLGAWTWVALVGTALGSVATVAYTVRFVWGAFATKRGVEAVRDVPEHPDFLLAPVVLALAGVAFGVASPWVDHWFAGYADALPAAAEESYHLALWHGLEPALAVSTVILAAGAAWVAIAIRRESRSADGARAPRPRADAQSAYEAALAGLDRAAAKTTATMQRGSLPFYLAVILTVFVAGVALALAFNRAWPTELRLWDSPWQLVVAAVMIAAGVAAARATKRFQAAVLASVTGYGMVVLFAMQGAPDLALTQALVELAMLFAIVLVLRRLPARLGEANGSRRPVIRAVIGTSFGVVMAVVAIVAAGARTDLPVSVGWPELAVTIGHGANVVNVALVDLRGWDTLGELTVVLAAATGVASLVFVSTRDDTLPRLTRGQAIRETQARMRKAADPTTPDRGSWLLGGRTLAPHNRSILLEVTVRLIFHAVIVVSLFVLLTGHNAPGGGFAGGLVAGMALVARYLAGGRHELGAAAPVAAGALLGTGLLLAAGTAAGSLVFGADALTSTWFTVDLGPIGSFDFVTSAIFDIGVYLIVIGLILDVLRSLGAEVDRHEERRIARREAGAGS